ncbi:hypothetical protein ACWGNA_27050, partial [Brucella cytisi]
PSGAELGRAGEDAEVGAALAFALGSSRRDHRGPVRKVTTLLRLCVKLSLNLARTFAVCSPN